MIIYHADDYGISINASKEILALVQQGKLSGISVIPNMSCFADCIDLLLPVMKERPALTVALHLNFFEGHCCADPAKIPLLVDENGYFNYARVLDLCGRYEDSAECAEEGRKA